VSKDRYHRLERSYGSFERAFRVPPGVREEDIKASVAYGVLRVTIPKPAQAKARKVPLTGG
jgi:HSP20 family protein